MTGSTCFNWGLIPGWVKDEKQAKDISNMTLNAIGETVFEKPSFRNSIRSKRCLLGINGFFEWRDVGGKKYPYYVQVKEEEIFSLGCLWENLAE
jgi:putative SOS response-associated peptidase YedK